MAFKRLRRTNTPYAPLSSVSWIFAVSANVPLCIYGGLKERAMEYFQ